MSFSFRKLIFGSPLRSERAIHEKLPIILALPIFASDALSSVAYATETILKQFQKLHVRQDQFGIAIGISMAIVTLILMVVISYKQVIYSYPRGGGSYIVARENLGVFIGLVAASALLVDYILTVSVSIADCVAQSNSALIQINSAFRELEHHKALLSVMLVLLITYVNLRGVRESGATFAGPSYGFIILVILLIGAGCYRLWFGGGALESVAAETDPKAVTGVDWLIIVRGFASGCAALTGIEAISNGVPTFKHPESRNAVLTLGILGGFLAFMFTGITYLAVQFKIGPSETETVISQIARASFGTSMPGGILYYGVLIFTSAILFLAANTAYSSYPRLCSLLAEDGYLPRQLTSIGDRLSYNNGILVLAFCSILFLLVFQGEAHALIPLYTIGVFIAFTTAQLGMVKRSWHMTPRPWIGLIINLIGGLITLAVLFVVGSSKFIAFEQPPLFGTTWFYEGAWMAITLMAIIVWVFYAIHRHYQNVDRQLAVIPPDAMKPFRHTVVVLVPSRIHRGILMALNYARSISPDAVAVHIAFDRSREQNLRDQWEAHGGDTPLIILDSPYRTLVGPLMQYLDAAEKVRSDDIITVVLPEFVPARWWHTLLHNASGWLLRIRLHYRKDIVVVSVRYYLD